MKWPIVITSDGDVLTHYPDAQPDDDLPLSICIAVHAICHGFVDIKETSATTSALHCRSCGLRVVVPSTVETYGDLRRHFSALQPDAWPAPLEPGQRIVCTRRFYLFKRGDEGTVLSLPSHSLMRGLGYKTWAQFGIELARSIGDEGRHCFYDGEIGPFGPFRIRL